jgi:monovalent cation:H+ antiporter-2, CPA2 family
MQSSFLVSFASVLCVAAVTTVIFQRLKLPVVLGYLLAGLLLGPSGIGVNLTNSKDVHTLAELGVILLMFALGLEFSFRDLARAGMRGAVTALFEIATMLWLGFLAARLLGFAPLPSVFIASMLAISSTTLIVRVFHEEKVRGKVRQLVLGMLVFEDLIAILLLSALTTLSVSHELTFTAVAESGLKLSLFLLVAISVGVAVVPRVFRFVLALNRAETTLVSGLGLAFAGALAAQAMGYSVALGAFLAGSLAAQAGATKKLEPLIWPVRDVFAAVFFVAVGMSIEPSVIVQQPLALVVFSVLVVLGKFIGVSAGAFATGAGLRTSLHAGLSAGQIGEFSFIIAALARELPGGSTLFALAVGVSTLTALCTPTLVRHSPRIAQWLERKLPHPVQTFVSLYASWIEATQRRQTSVLSVIRKRLVQLSVDLLLIIAVIILAALFHERLLRLIDLKTPLAQNGALAGFVIVLLSIILPLLWGASALIVAIGRAIASAAFAEPAGTDVDFAAAPRRAFRLALSFGFAVACGLILLVSTQAFLPAGGGSALFILLILALGVTVFRGANNLQGHVRAGAQALFEVLAGRSQSEQILGQTDHLDDAEALLPGLGELHALVLAATSGAVGQSLSALNLRGRTGAAVILIRRGAEAITAPGGAEILMAGDQLVLSGSIEAVRLAEKHLL